jgi:hypothetical protein
VWHEEVSPRLLVRLGYAEALRQVWPTKAEAGMNESGPLGEAGARLRAIVARWKDSREINFEREQMRRMCAAELEAELDAAVVSPLESAIEAEIAQQEAYALLPASFAWPSMTPDHHRHVASILKLVLANLRLSALVVSGWQPIATAPKDGTQIWAWDDERGSNPAMWVESEWWITYDDATIQPTHWMPLPAAPVVTQEGE